MKKFSFPLDRVLSWRQTQVRLAEAQLDLLRAELHLVDERRSALEQAVLEEGARLGKTGSASPVELAAMEHYRGAARAESARLNRARHTLEAKIAGQTQAVLDRRREARLLERLRERRLGDWRAATSREIEQLAEESFLSRLARCGQWGQSPRNPP